jgi:hypothetical protein
VQEITVPNDLRRAHQTIKATRAAASGLRPGADGRVCVGPVAGIIYMILSRDLLRLALLTMQGVFSEAERRGWQVVSFEKQYDRHAGVAIGIGQQRYPIEIHEITETIPFTEEDIRAWRNQRGWIVEFREGKMPPPQQKRRKGTGHLKLVLPNGYGGGRASWSGGPRGPLARKLPSVFETLEERAAEDDRADAARAVAAEADRKEAEERERRARAARVDRARAERLIGELEAWRRSGEIAEYVAALRAALPGLDPEDKTRVEAWADWAEDWARRSNPAVQPSLIVGRDAPTDALHYR